MNLVYKNITISNNSQAYQLLISKQFKKLDTHLHELEEKRKKLET